MTSAASVSTVARTARLSDLVSPEGERRADLDIRFDLAWREQGPGGSLGAAALALLQQGVEPTEVCARLRRSYAHSGLPETERSVVQELEAVSPETREALRSRIHLELLMQRAGIFGRHGDSLRTTAQSAGVREREMRDTDSSPDERAAARVKHTDLRALARVLVEQHAVRAATRGLPAGASATVEGVRTLGTAAHVAAQRLDALLAGGMDLAQACTECTAVVAAPEAVALPVAEAPRRPAMRH